MNTSVLSLDLHLRPQKGKKTKASSPVTPRSTQPISMWFGTLLTMAGLLNVMLIIFRPISIPVGEPYVGDFAGKIINVSLCSEIYKPVSLKLVMMIYIAELYSLTHF